MPRTDPQAPVNPARGLISILTARSLPPFLDLTSSAQDRDHEIQGLLALGARRADIGQTSAEPWTVLAASRETSSA